MELNWLEDFISLATTGSFSKAAEYRNISQSAFSRRIHALEHWLGTSLVDRHNHPVTLTDAGSQFMATANQVVSTIYKTREDFGYRDRTRSRTLCMGVADHLSIHFVPGWLRSIEPHLGNRKIQLVTGLKAGLGFVELLKEQRLDLLLAYGGTISKDHESGAFESVNLDQDVLVPVCATSLLDDETYRFPTRVEQPLTYISYMPASSMANLVNREANRRKSPIHLRPVIETGTAETIKALALQGFGMAWLPQTAIVNELKQGKLAELPGGKHRIPFKVTLFRYSANTRHEVVTLWDRLIKRARSRE
jgi:DNA-binding transcriptional LysR family regulator